MSEYEFSLSCIFPYKENGQTHVKNIPCSGWLIIRNCLILKLLNRLSQLFALFEKGWNCKGLQWVG